MRIVLCLILVFACISSISFATPQILINVPEYTLSVIDKGQVVKKYDIAVGTPYEQTPLGNFAIFIKLEDPVWFPGAKFTDRTPVPPGPDNPLGTRWMEFAPTYGIHGTNLDWSITYPVSGGCVRMHDKDARELYAMAPIGTPVAVVYETLRVVERSDGLYLRVMPDIYGRKTSTRESFQSLLAPYERSYRLKLPEFPLKEADEIYEIRLGRKDGAQAVGLALPPEP